MEILEKQIEALLFWKNEPVSFKELGKIFDVSANDAKNACISLSTKNAERGINLILGEEEVVLATSKESSEKINELRKEELSRDLSKASLETLSIILYKGPVNRQYIDFVRGVNSQFIIRALLMRGLISKLEEKGGNSNSYVPSLELLAYLGVTKQSDLPDFETVVKELDELEKNQDEKQ